MLEQAKRMRGMWDVNRGNPNFRSDFSHVHKRKQSSETKEMMAMFTNALTVALERHESKKQSVTADNFTSEISTFSKLSVSDEEEEQEHRRMNAHP